MSDQPSAAKRSAIERLGELLQLAGLDVKFGLRQQGHLPLIKLMLAQGKSWDEIGRAIGWHGPTAQKFYERYEGPNATEPFHVE